MIHTRKIFGKLYEPYLLFNEGCSWRKCTFCNIGKFPQEYIIDKKRAQHIQECLDDIEKRKVPCIKIVDPSIEVRELEYFAEKVIERDLDIRIHTRTRFTEDFTPEVCKKLYDAGVRFMGM